MRMVTHRQNGIISVVVLFHLAILEMSSLQATLLVDDVPTIKTYIDKFNTLGLPYWSLYAYG